MRIGMFVAQQKKTLIPEDIGENNMFLKNRDDWLVNNNLTSQIPYVIVA